MDNKKQIETAVEELTALLAEVICDDDLAEATLKLEQIETAVINEWPDDYNPLDFASDHIVERAMRAAIPQGNKSLLAINTLLLKNEITLEEAISTVIGLSASAIAAIQQKHGPDDLKPQGARDIANKAAIQMRSDITKLLRKSVS